MIRTYRSSKGMETYLKADRFVDWKDPSVSSFAAALFSECDGTVACAEKAFLFVRDEVRHSWDIGSRLITRTASEVLRQREGICYAKANLLAALLRYAGIPAGFCYQKLTLGDTPDTGYCVHALNAFWLDGEKRWIRLDARGNKPGVCAAFSLGEERLAFPVRPEYGEEDYPGVYADPAPATIAALERNTDCMTMCLHDLPVSL